MFGKTGRTAGVMDNIEFIDPGKATQGIMGSL
jgi:hypothetical protein